MTVQEISDEFTLLSHQGKAQAVVMHVSGEAVKNITGIELIGDDTALIISEKTDPELKDKLLDLKANCDLAIEGRDVKVMELEEENTELKSELTKKADTNHTLVEQMADMEIENEQLKAQIESNQKYIADLEESNNAGSVYISNLENQIEKMKCCINCKHYTWNMSNEKCQFRCESRKACDNWEVEE